MKTPSTTRVICSFPSRSSGISWYWWRPCLNNQPTRCSMVSLNQSYSCCHTFKGVLSLVRCHFSSKPGANYLALLTDRKPRLEPGAAGALRWRHAEAFQQTKHSGSRYCIQITFWESIILKLLRFQFLGYNLFKVKQDLIVATICYFTLPKLNVTNGRREGLKKKNYNISVVI